MLMLPKFIKPMLAATASEPFDSQQYVFEVKWDGIRCLAFVEGRRVRLQSRQLMDLTAQFPELDSLRALPDGTVLDGELVVLEQQRPSLSKVQQRVQRQDRNRIRLLSQQSPAAYMVFDLLYLRGRAVMRESLTNRREMLGEIVGTLRLPGVHVTESIAACGRALFREVMRRGLEGVMAKRADSEYLPGKRSRTWQKIKPGNGCACSAGALKRSQDTEAISSHVGLLSDSTVGPESTPPG